MQVGECKSNCNWISSLGSSNTEQKNHINNIASESGKSEALSGTLDFLGTIGRAYAATSAKISPNLLKLLAQKEELEKAGFDVKIQPNNLLSITSKDTETPTRVGITLLKNVSEINGNVIIYNDDRQFNADVRDLKTINGNVNLYGFNSECRENGASNWGYACEIKFPNLETVGNLTVKNSACYLVMPKLANVKGSFNVDSSCDYDNVVYVPGIKNIQGDLNIQRGNVVSSPAIFNAVEGSMNAVPPLAETNGYLTVKSKNTESIYLFTNEPEKIVKEKTIKY